MPSSSDSDSLPDIGQVLATRVPSYNPDPNLISEESVPIVNFKAQPGNNRKRKKLLVTSLSHSKSTTSPHQQHHSSSSSRPRKKQKLQNGKVNGRTRATPSAGLSSDDESRRSTVTPKLRHKGNIDKYALKHTPSEVIDLCSDSENAPKSPPRTQKMRVQPPPALEEDIIELLSSDNEVGPTSNVPHPAPCNAQLRNDISLKSPLSTRVAAASSFKALAVGKEEEEEESPLPEEEEKIPIRANDVLQSVTSPPFRLPLKKGKFGSVSHIPSVHEAAESIPPARLGPWDVKVAPSLKDSTVPPDPTSADFSSVIMPSPKTTTSLPNAFSSRTNVRPHPAMKIVDLQPFNAERTPPPLLTGAFFTRANKVLLPPMVTPTSKSGNPTSLLTNSPLPKNTPVKRISSRPTPKSPSPAVQANSRARSHPEKLFFEQVECPEKGSQFDSLLSAPQSPRDATVSVGSQEATESPKDTYLGGTEVTQPSTRVSDVFRPQPSRVRLSSHQNDTSSTLSTQEHPHINLLLNSGLPQDLKDEVTTPVSTDRSTGFIASTTTTLPPPPFSSASGPEGNVDEQNDRVNIGGPKNDQDSAEPHTPTPESQSATDIQEIVDMLLEKGGTDFVELTDEELLAIGLRYPDSDS